MTISIPTVLMTSSTGLSVIIVIVAVIAAGIIVFVSHPCCCSIIGCAEMAAAEVERSGLLKAVVTIIRSTIFLVVGLC